MRADGARRDLVFLWSNRARRQPLAALVATDHAAWAVALVVALIARFEFDFGQVTWKAIPPLLIAAAIAQLGVGLAIGLYRHRHRVGTHAEFRYLAGTSMAVGILLSFVAAPLFQGAELDAPRSLGLLAAPLALLFMAAARSQWRTLQDHMRRPGEDAVPILVYGAGDAGSQIIRAMMRDPESRYHPVALLDDQRRLWGRRVEELRVLGGADMLRQAALTHNAHTVLIAIPTASAARIRDLSQRCRDADLEVKVLPPTRDIVDGRVGVGDIRSITITDLLHREQATLDVEAISHYVTGRRVLVTGAGGSIGSELSRQLSDFEPAALCMLDRDESALLDVELSIDGLGQMASDRLMLADIRDRDRIQEIFERFQPEVVFHAAALKHVPLLEHHPVEGFLTNVIGTHNVLAASLSVGVSHFVNISTDKAADPDNVLGYTKRIAERLTADADDRSEGSFISVRFGNVLGSRGSVLGTFEKQIRNGGPVTVTHPDITRFFMTIEEAVRLVIQAGAIGEAGEVLVLDMGEPVQIVQLAEQLIDFSNADVAIEYTGLRPGERMHERLFSQHEIGVKNRHPKIWHTPVPPLSLDDIDRGASLNGALVPWLQTMVTTGLRLEHTA